MHIHELQKIGPERILQKRSPQAAFETGPRGFLIEGVRAIVEFRGLFSFFGLRFSWEGRFTFLFWYEQRPVFLFGVKISAMLGSHLIDPDLFVP